ncbi:MAG: hypothetical protein LBQ98_09210 [Nitrososphaerota archaeon]|jgi:rRNA maturation protein Nop10|nr:hypothetical protein [Nitrososphaerota archaeon]
MPFCRKCGRRLSEYSEKCPECGTSTTAVLINIKKVSSQRLFHAPKQAQAAKVVAISVDSMLSVKAISPSRTEVVKTKADRFLKTNPSVVSAKSVVSAIDYLPHEIIQSKLSLGKDILANPKDYETQTFEFNLRCPYGHFWPEGRALPVSNGVAFCPRCGERLRKPKPKRRRRQYEGY